MAQEIQIVDRGRGLQLSTSRVTVMDLVPYFQQGCSFSEIIRWIPSLTDTEIAVVERYYREHKAELDEKDRLARARREEQIRQQRLRFPELVETQEERLLRMRLLLEKRRQEKNGDGHSG
jgi:uncharacterized protein (DUF433 family)